MMNYLSISQVSINPRLCHRTEKRIILSGLYEQGSGLISIHYLVGFTKFYIMFTLFAKYIERIQIIDYPI